MATGLRGRKGSEKPSAEYPGCRLRRVKEPSVANRNPVAGREGVFRACVQDGSYRAIVGSNTLTLMGTTP